MGTRRRSTSHSSIMEDDVDGNRLRKRLRPTDRRLKWLLYFSCAVKSQARRILEQQDVAHGRKRSRHKPTRHETRQDIHSQNRHPVSNRASVRGSQSTLGASGEECLVRDSADLPKSDDNPITTGAVLDEALEEGRIGESEEVHSESDAEIRVNLEHDVDAVDPSRQRSRLVEDAEEVNDSDPESDVDEEPEFTPFLQEDDSRTRPEAYLEPGVSTPAVPHGSVTPILDAHGKDAHQTFAAADIVWVLFMKCATACPGKRRRGHEDSHHRGENHYLIISEVILEDGKEFAKGFTCTSFEQKENMSSANIEKYLRLEGGDNNFCSSITGGVKVPSKEGPELSIQRGDACKMRVPTYVEIEKVKKFPFKQLKARGPPDNPKECRQLETGSLKILLERTTWS